MKASLDKRLKVLEEKAKPMVIATLADYVLWAASDSDEEVEFSPAIQELIEEANSKPDES